MTRFPMRSAWPLIFLLCLLDAALLRGLGMGFAPGSLTGPLVGVVLLAGVAAVYTRLRPVPGLAGLALVGAEMVAYTAAAAVLSYALAAAGAGLPLIDDALVAFDRALGLDWLAAHAWIHAHPLLRLVLTLAYYSLYLQVVVVQIVLNVTGRVARGRELLWLFVLMSLGCIVVSAPFPAAGAFGTFGVGADEPYVRDFLALRSKTLAVVDLAAMRGIVQFPSFHLCLAVLLTYAARGVRLLFPLFVGINALVILATPVMGGHHFADLLGGAVLCGLVLVAARRHSRPRAA